MKFIPSIIFLSFLASASFAQDQEFQANPGSFSRIVVSPKISVILQKGDVESVRIRYSHITSGKIHVERSGKTLHLYLENAKLIDRREKITDNRHTTRESVYRNVSVTAYITYRALEKLSVRGEEEVLASEPIVADKFKLKAYGESEIEIASLTASRLKLALYGSNSIKIKGGEVGSQKLKLFGDNRVDTRAIESERIASTIYGEGKIKVNASHVFHLTALGEPQVQLSGHAHVHKGIVLGRPQIYSELQ